MSFYNTLKFFKIIQNHELQNGSELRIPKKFVENFWKTIPNPVVIILPNGVKQKLFWTKRDGEIWFNKNWEKISKFLKYGYLVIFNYIGGPCFQLNIFGTNCLEIDYSIDEVIVSDDNVQAEFVTKSQRTKFGKRKMNAGLGLIGTSRGVTNPSFQLELKETYANGYLFRIPKKFSKIYMKDFEGTARIRRVGENKTWKVKVKSRGGYSAVNSGWKPFCKEHNLQIGDVCKFEMIQSKKLSFIVTIIRAEE